MTSAGNSVNIKYVCLDKLHKFISVHKFVFVVKKVAVIHRGEVQS